MGQLTGNLPIQQELLVSLRIERLWVGEAVQVLHVVVIRYLQDWLLFIMAAQRDLLVSAFLL